MARTGGDAMLGRDSTGNSSSPSNMAAMLLDGDEGRYRSLSVGLKTLKSNALSAEFSDSDATIALGVLFTDDLIYPL